MNSSDEQLMQRLRNELIDSYDEELEMELDDRTLAELTGEGGGTDSVQDKESRRQYFRELFRLVRVVVEGSTAMRKDE